MENNAFVRYSAIVLLCLINLSFGLHAGQPPMLLGGAAGLVYVAQATIGGHTCPADAVQTPVT